MWLAFQTEFLRGNDEKKMSDEKFSTERLPSQMFHQFKKNALKH